MEGRPSLADTGELCALADVWDALRSDRPYPPAWSRERALAYIREQAGKHFDSAVIEVFFKLIESSPD